MLYLFDKTYMSNALTNKKDNRKYFYDIEGKDKTTYRDEIPKGLLLKVVQQSICMFKHFNTFVYIHVIRYRY